MNDKLWWTNTALKPSGADIGVKGSFGRKISDSVSVSANRILEIESDAVDQTERVQRHCSIRANGHVTLA